MLVVYVSLGSILNVMLDLVRSEHKTHLVRVKKASMFCFRTPVCRRINNL